VRFDRHVGIDYSGAGKPESPQPGLAVYMAHNGRHPAKIRLDLRRSGRWDRAMVADFLAELARQDGTFIAGLDHAFSFPTPYLKRLGLADWGAFLEHLNARWPTREEGVTVESLRSDNQPVEDPDLLRLTETWTSSARSVFRFDVQGQVAKSTRAGIPWLVWIREQVGQHVHFWPFDGWDVPAGKSVIAEVYPAIFKSRYPRSGDSPHEQDAYAAARWLVESDERGILDHYFHPPLSPDEKAQARREGWILGIG